MRWQKQWNTITTEKKTQARESSYLADSDRMNKLIQIESNCGFRVVIGWNRVRHGAGVRICVQDSNDRNVTVCCFLLSKYGVKGIKNTHSARNTCSRGNHEETGVSSYRNDIHGLRYRCQDNQVGSARSGECLELSKRYEVPNLPTVWKRSFHELSRNIVFLTLHCGLPHNAFHLST